MKDLRIDEGFAAEVSDIECLNCNTPAGFILTATFRPAECLIGSAHAAHAPCPTQEASRVLDAAFQSRTSPCPQNTCRHPERSQRGSARRSARLLGRCARRPCARWARNGRDRDQEGAQRK